MQNSAPRQATLAAPVVTLLGHENNHASPIRQDFGGHSCGCLRHYRVPESRICNNANAVVLAIPSKFSLGLRYRRVSD